MKKVSQVLKFMLFSFLAWTANAQTIDSTELKSLMFRHIGPFGNRISCTVGVPGDPFTYFAGAATGGIWKTVDGGIHWKPVFDDKPVHAIGALAVAPSDHQIIWAGTGEPFIRSNVSVGDGVWKSMDGGDTWEHAGLDFPGRVSRIIIHPTNPDIVYVGALGHGYAPQKERGIYRTTDGGKNWELVLHVNDNTGTSDLVMDPSNPRILFAGMWEFELRTWVRNSGGPGSGVFKSVDGGSTWQRLEGHGLPKGPVGKIALAMTPANPDRVYAQIETGDGVPLDGKPTDTGELWISDDKGKSWKMVNPNRDIGGRQAYYTRCAASPDNPHEVYFIAANWTKSIDDGRTLMTPQDQPNWDHHDMWIDPMDGNRMIVAGDGGISVSQNRGESWLKKQLAVAQVYHVTTDTHVPYNVYTNRQDGPAMRGPSRSKAQGMLGPSSIPRGMWHDIGGGESGFATPDPEDPDIIWSSASGRGPLGGIVVRYNEKIRQYRDVEVWPEMTTGHPASDVKYRFQWTFPLLISPHDHNTIYVTSQVVHKTTNGGQSWTVISPDLTKNEPAKQKFSGGLTGDNINVEYGNVIYAFDESPAQAGVLWAGTNDGLVQVSQDGGAHWTDVTKNLPGIPKDGVVRNIDASKWSAGKAYLTIEAHQVGDFKTYVYKTEDFGKKWMLITDGIEQNNLNYTRCVREDPVRQGLLYLGTESMLFVSFDDGAHWQSLMTNMPHTPMYWIDIQEEFNDMVVGTYGRGIWILDDISALQELTPAIQKGKSYLFDIHDTYRFQPRTAIMPDFDDPSEGQDPPYGVSLNYWLNQEVKDSVHFKIINAAGDTVRTLHAAPKPGLNRLWWNLLDDSGKKLMMHTPPLFADWVPMGKAGTRPVHLGPAALLVPPGDYQVAMMVGDDTYHSSLKVMKDPDSEGTNADIMAQHQLLTAIRADLNDVVGLVNAMELVRVQLNDLKKYAGMHADKKAIEAAIHEVDSLATDLEGTWIQLKITGTGQDIVRWPAELAEQLDYLISGVSSVDYPPTDQHKQVATILHDKTEKAKADFEQFKSNQLDPFLQKLQEWGVGPISLPRD